MKAIVALIAARSLDSDLLGLLVLCSPLVLGANSGHEDLGEHQRALAHSNTAPRIEIPRFWDIWNIVCVDARSLHDSISDAFKLRIFFRLACNLYPSVLRLLYLTNSVFQARNLMSDCTDITAIGTDDAPDDDDGWQGLAPGSLIRELLDLCVGLEKADDPVRIAPAPVDRVASEGHRREADRDADGVRAHSLSTRQALIAVREIGPEGLQPR
mmetsp:Transcript_137305/g.293361  ORF Transcript_137305/g.293361 Transcript_137305/m.293361 type:complete len:213 (+) Transcript_137305:971-1609(+)